MPFHWKSEYSSLPFDMQIVYPMETKKNVGIAWVFLKSWKEGKNTKWSEISIYRILKLITWFWPESTDYKISFIFNNCNESVSNQWKSNIQSLTDKIDKKKKHWWIKKAPIGYDVTSIFELILFLLIDFYYFSFSTWVHLLIIITGPNLVKTVAKP